MRNAFNELREEGAGTIIGWLETLAERVGADAVWEWIASRTQFAMEQAGELTASLAEWDGVLDLDVGAIGEAVARVVATEFEEALSTTEELLKNISAYQRNAHIRTRFGLLQYSNNCGNFCDVLNEDICHA